jgi:hypothetical protein
MFSIVTRNLFEAISSKGQERTMRIGTAARWDLEIPQIFL